MKLSPKNILRLFVVLILGFALIYCIINYKEQGLCESVAIRVLGLLGIIYLAKKIWD